MSKLTKRDINNDFAFKCEGCGAIELQDDAYPHEFYSDKDLTIFLEDILYCKKCARNLFSIDEFEWGGKKEYAYSD